MSNESGPTKVETGPLGLLCFGLTTVLLSLVNAGILPTGGLACILPFGLVIGGFTQCFAGFLQLKEGNTFSFTAFAGYGAFWIWFATMSLWGNLGIVDLANAGSTTGTALVLWAIFSFAMWPLTFKMTRYLACIFTVLWPCFLCLGLCPLLQSAGFGIAGGYLGLIAGAVAIYGCIADIWNEVLGRKVLPV